MRSFVSAMAVLLVIGGVALVASGQEKRENILITFPQTMALIGEFSKSYIDALQQRQKLGQFILTPQDTTTLKRRINELVSRLEQLKTDGPLDIPSLGSTENYDALTAALICRDCTGKLLPGARVEVLKSRGQLRSLLSARCQMILSILPINDSSPVSLPTFFALTLHFSYLQQIAVAYADLDW